MSLLTSIAVSRASWQSLDCLVVHQHQDWVHVHNNVHRLHISLPCCSELPDHTCYHLCWMHHHSTGHDMQTAGVPSGEEHPWWWRPDSLHQYFPPDRGQLSLHDLEGPHLPTLMLIVNCSLFTMSVHSSATILNKHYHESLGSFHGGFAEPWWPADTRAKQ